ncbi:helix-turn-helix domain-containing protein [Cohnella nanjingensis]|uniref:Helix-turn-helix transcriptional regulator n=1 Tax=Cohnella nanjingensis TaxID=1387779 RepID=A0A7X0RMG4_9BACL|nr:AraC family transcriptional regulator [Cohnella nanjingensis]MBB6670233.1 helix-turn-helix transcriptional regulator [Cohnella nanjingensis]
MTNATEYGTYGFRFAESPELPLCGLFAVGREREACASYRWDGLTREDGPLLLFQYTLAGEGAVEIGERKEAVGAGRAFLVDIPGDHRYYLPADKPEWAFYFLLFRPRLVMPAWEAIKAKLGDVVDLPAGSAPIRQLRAIFEDARDGKIADPYSASSHVYQFVMALARFASSPDRGQEAWPAAVRSAVRYIDTNYAGMIGQAQLAAESGLSKYHFLRTFSRYVGLTPIDYVNRVRIERSIELLGRSDCNIEAIASAVGYSSGSYFIKVFRKLTGQTPGQFREGRQLPYSRLFFDT